MTVEYKRVFQKCQVRCGTAPELFAGRDGVRCEGRVHGHPMPGPAEGDEVFTCVAHALPWHDLHGRGHPPRKTPAQRRRDREAGK